MTITLQFVEFPQPPCDFATCRKNRKTQQRVAKCRGHVAENRKDMSQNSKDMSQKLNLGTLLMISFLFLLSVIYVSRDRVSNV
jgi:hypothetical protein